MSTPETQMPQQETWADALAIPLGLFGAMLGAIVGAVVVKLAYQSGFYAVPLIGLGAGLGSVLIARRGSIAHAIIAAIVAAITGVVAEWAIPMHVFKEDPSFLHFVTHVHTLRAFPLMLHGISIILAGYLAWRK